mgnify:FL=1
MSTGYTETILIDCNRLSSVEYSASKLSQTNNALFTNKVSDGITVNVGDTVTVQSAHISQRGAGANVIEFRGEDLGRKTIEYTNTVSASYIGFDEEPLDATGLGRYSPTGYVKESSSLIEEEVHISDNAASIVIDYYKNANGENYITLPRNWGNASCENASYAGQIFPPGIANGDPAIAQPSITNGSFWTNKDNYLVGLNTFCTLKSHIFVADYNFKESSKGQSALNICGTACEVQKLINDNSRYTIFKKKEIIWQASGVSASDLKDWLDPYGVGATTGPDPATHQYVRFKQKVDINVPAGYNSPSNVAANITDELNQTDDPITILQKVNGSRVGASVVNSTINKAFPCANYRSFSGSSNLDFFDAALQNRIPYGIGAGAPLQTKAATDYLNSYAYIGFKRPDFVEQGRKHLAYHGATLQTESSSPGHLTVTLKTNISYNDAALSGLLKFFDTQKELYPELLDAGLEEGRSDYATYNTTSSSLSASFREEARFLHLDIGTHTKTAAQPLGSDMYNEERSTTTGLPATGVADLTSIPLFFYFNKDSRHMTTEMTVGDRFDNLAYGFARKWIQGGEALTELTFELLGGIPTMYYSQEVGGIKDRIRTGTKLGYDYHFGAYGNAAIMPTNGMNAVQYEGLQAFINAPTLRQVYMGANNPLFNFDTIENRFEISNLHTSEKVGNFITAGEPTRTGDIFTPPVAPQGNLDVYKLNKQLSYTAWSPSMLPYSMVSSSYQASDTTSQVSFIQMNPNLDFASVYDSHSGVTILDMGVNETLWQQSIWGILGWEYSQFNTSGSNIKNSNVRMSNVITNVSGLTTNANITSTDSLSYLANAFATNLYLPMVNSDIYSYNIAKIMGNNAGREDGLAHTVQPPSTIAATSTLLKAANLPRKILRGYFTISSDILDATGYLQKANPMSVMAVAGKYSAENDFVEYTGGGAVFTITRKKTITDVTSQILDPEGRAAQVGDNSGIIYRVDRQVNTDLHFAENVLNGTIK